MCLSFYYDRELELGMSSCENQLQQQPIITPPAYPRGCPEIIRCRDRVLRCCTPCSLGYLRTPPRVFCFRSPYSSFACRSSTEYAVQCNICYISFTSVFLVLYFIVFISAPPFPLINTAPPPPINTPRTSAPLHCNRCYHTAHTTASQRRQTPCFVCFVPVKSVFACTAATVLCCDKKAFDTAVLRSFRCKSRIKLSLRPRTTRPRGITRVGATLPDESYTSDTTQSSMCMYKKKDIIIVEGVISSVRVA